MEAQIIAFMKQEMEDTRHELMMVKLKLASLFSPDSDDFGSPLDIFETIERLYLSVWKVKPTLEQINKYAQEKLKWCSNGSIMMEEDEVCDCPFCEEREENENEFCKGCQKALTKEDREYETSQVWYEGDECGENCINCVNDFIKQ
jgi:hypothetical protein